MPNLWSGNGGATYEGYREYLMRVKEQGWPEPPAAGPFVEEIEIAPDQDAGPPALDASLHAATTTEGTEGAWELTREESGATEGGEGGSATPTSTPASPLSPEAELSAGSAEWRTAPPPPHADYSLFHTFHVTDQPVSLVKFARCSSDLLAFAGHDSAVYLAATDAPPRLLQARAAGGGRGRARAVAVLGLHELRVRPWRCALQVLERHTGRVTDLDFSHDNTFLLSSSDDGTVCLWLVETGALVRVFRNAGGAVLSCRFHPVNPTILFLGTAFGEVLVLNSSTGLMITKIILRPAHMAGVGASCLELSPNLLLVADTCSTVHLLSRQPSPHEVHDVACLEFIPHSALARGPAVLLVDSASQVVLYRLHERQRKHWLEAKAAVRMPQASVKVRASVCPTAGAEPPEALLMGGEDGAVHMLDLAALAGGRRRRRGGLGAAMLAQLEGGHEATVVGVAWSYDEAAVASCDRAGGVALWARVEPSAAFFSDSFDAEV
eukprot:scaffold6.g2759.t1